MNLSEKEGREKVEADLGQYFYLYPEQKGYLYKPDGTKSLKRLDLVIQHQHYRDFVLGVEFKTLGVKKGYELANICRQMMMYSFIEWDYKNNHQNWGRIPIVSYPNITLRHLEFISGHKHEPNHDHNNVNSFLAQAFNIGEFRPVEVDEKMFKKICFANKVLWREFDFGVDIAAINHYRDVRKNTGKYVQNDVHIFNYKKIQENINKYVQQMRFGA